VLSASGGPPEHDRRHSNLIFGAVGARLPRRPILVIAFSVAGGPPLLALAVGLPLGALVAVIAVAGFCAGAVNPMIGAVKLECVPAGLRARVYGLIQAGAWAAVPLGALVGGFGVDRLALTLAPAVGGPWRGLDNRPAPVSSPDARRPYV